MSEGMNIEVPGPGEWLKSQQRENPELHLDESKMVDAADKLADRLGLNGAIAELEDSLAQNEDAELRRQLNLLKNRTQH